METAGNSETPFECCQTLNIGPVAAENYLIKPKLENQLFYTLNFFQLISDKAKSRVDRETESHGALEIASRVS